MPIQSPSQGRLMEAAAHTPGGYGGVPQSVGKEFVSATPADKLKAALRGRRQSKGKDNGSRT